LTVWCDDTQLLDLFLKEAWLPFSKWL
jgi:hypothetical protein